MPPLPPSLLLIRPSSPLRPTCLLILSHIHTLKIYLHLSYKVTTICGYLRRPIWSIPHICLFTTVHRDLGSRLGRKQVLLLPGQSCPERKFSYFDMTWKRLSLYPLPSDERRVAQLHPGDPGSCTPPHSERVDMENLFPPGFCCLELSEGLLFVPLRNSC